VVLIQDRPVLGGNASSEVRLWVLGATSHLGNNNRWSREGGVVDEMLVENLYRNREGNPNIFDTVMLEMVVNEPNITLLLNTAVYEVTKDGPDRIKGVRAFCSQNSTFYDVTAPLFCDASGDGIVGFMAGAAFRMGAESSEEFGEKFAPKDGYGDLLGHSIYFYSKDVGRPVTYVPPSFALRDITQIPRWRNFNTKEFGCQLWWIEYGGTLDTVHDTEQIKWELWKVVYGVWNHIKNSGQFPEAQNMTLEWVGTVPGKRESRRFQGGYMLIQQDIVEQRRHYDAVAHGGWAMDLHPADGVFSEKPGCNQWHSKGVYEIPYRCMYSNNIENLFLAGRIISASHVAFASTRVMATCAHAAQAVGMAAAICRQQGLTPRELGRPEKVKILQSALLRSGQHIPHVELPDGQDLAARAAVSASSRMTLSELPRNGSLLPLVASRAMLLPVAKGFVPAVTFSVAAKAPTALKAELRVSSRAGNFTPDVMLASRSVALRHVAVVGAGAASGGGPSGGHELGATTQDVTIDFETSVPEDCYVMICLMANPDVSVASSDVRMTGVLSLEHRGSHRVAEGASQTPPQDIGVEAFEFWLPGRRPGGPNLALQLGEGLDVFGPANVTCGPDRPTIRPNAWVASMEDAKPWVELRWEKPVSMQTVELAFDNDFDHPLESVLMGHPERELPFCVRSFRLLDDRGTVVASVTDNHQTRRPIRLEQPFTTQRLRVEVDHPSAVVPAAVMRVRCYE
jgi:hypothetical protein